MGKQLMRLAQFLHQKDSLALHWALCIVSLDQRAGVLNSAIVSLLCVRTPGGRGRPYPMHPPASDPRTLRGTKDSPLIRSNSETISFKKEKKKTKTIHSDWIL